MRILAVLLVLAAGWCVIRVVQATKAQVQREAEDEDAS
jgi:hypothetical protein